MWFCSWLREIEPDGFEEVEWFKALVDEDEAAPKDLEFWEAFLERVLVLDCGWFEKLAGSTRFFAGGWGRESEGSAARF